MSLYYSAEVYDSTMTRILQSSPSCSLMVKVVVLLVVNTSTSIESIALYYNLFLSGSAIDPAWPQCNSIGGTKTPTESVFHLNSSIQCKKSTWLVQYSWGGTSGPDNCTTYCRNWCVCCIYLYFVLTVQIAVYLLVLACSSILHNIPGGLGGLWGVSYYTPPSP